METEPIGKLLLDEIEQLPEVQREQVNMTAVMGMIAMEVVRRDAHDSCYICKQRAEEFQASLIEGQR